MEKNSNHPRTEKNPFGAGRPRINYETKRVTVPVDLLEQLNKMIEDYKKGFEGYE